MTAKLNEISLPVKFVQNLTRSQHTSDLIGGHGTFVRTFTAACLTAVFLIFRMILYIASKTTIKREKRHVRVYVLHLCGVALLSLGLCVEYMLQKFNVIPTGPRCRWTAGLRAFAAPAFLLIKSKIFHERRKISVTTTDISILPRPILLIYVVAILFSSLSFFSMEYIINIKTGLGICKQTPIGSLGVTVAYELLILVLFYIVPIIYIAVVLWRIQIRVRFQNIYNWSLNIHSQRNQSRKRTWVICDYFVGSVLLWIVGFLNFLNKVLDRQGNGPWAGKSIALLIVLIAYFCHLISFPVFYLRGIEKLSLDKIFFGFNVRETWGRYTRPRQRRYEPLEICRENAVNLDVQFEAWKVKLGLISVIPEANENVLMEKGVHNRRKSWPYIPNNRSIGMMRKSVSIGDIPSSKLN